MEGIKPSILTKKDVYTLKVMKEFGRKAAITDTCVVTGCDFSSSTIYNTHVSYDDSLKGRIGSYALLGCDSNNEIEVIGSFGAEEKESAHNSGYCIRLKLQLSKELFDKVVSRSYIGYNDIRFVDFGFYPQYVPDWEIQKRYSKDSNYVTKIYDARKYNLGIWDNEEIEYLGKRYVIARANFSVKKYKKVRSFYSDPIYKPVMINKEREILTNGHQYRQGDLCLLEILPVSWLIDYDTQTLISKNCLLSGINYFETYQSKSDVFEESKLGLFICEHMVPEILQGVDFVNIKETKPIEVSLPKIIPRPTFGTHNPISNTNVVAKTPNVEPKKEPVKPQQPVEDLTAIHPIVKHNRLSRLMSGVVGKIVESNEGRLRNVKTKILILPYGSSDYYDRLIKYFISRLNDLIDRYNEEYETLNNEDLTEFGDSSFDAMLLLLENDVDREVNLFYEKMEKSGKGFSI